ncbi:hypothetical protein PR002_g13812 [Phytophthora rubi]|uniref:Uncharacterized protein n=1 Tax=Phytophthora rubi TaxID=129364 RepID=A0A6A3LA44_9STRA|nr:hypothetical protein PR002_g13812 [Phytophthora rubi]
MSRKPMGTQQEIEEALLRNVRVNMTPAKAEDAADKRKRQKRRSAAKRGLEKELAALALTDANDSVPVAVTRIADDERPHEGQEGKQEEDNPAEHQHRYAAAYAEGQRAAEYEDVPAASPILASPDRAAVVRARNAERARICRANMSASQKERTKAINKERARASRARRTEEKRSAVREIDRLRKQQRRARQTQAER